MIITDKAEYDSMINSGLLSASSKKDFETAFSWIKEIGTSSKSIFNFEREILIEKLNAEGQKTLDDTKTSMLKSHFESYFGINEFQGEYQEAYMRLVGKLYETMTLSAFQASSKKKYNQEIKDRLNHQIDFAILTLLMEEAGITEIDLKTEEFPKKLRTYINNINNKKHLMEIFKSEKGKQRILNEFLSTFFVTNPNSDKLITSTTTTYYGYQEEVRYNLFRLSKRVKAIFKQLIGRVENSQYTIDDLLNIRIYDKTIYSPDKVGYLNKLNLNFGKVIFYDRTSMREYDGIGIIEILGFILSTEIKSTMYSTMFQSYALATHLMNDGISSMINSFFNLIDFKDTGNINNIMLNLKTRVVQLVGSIISPGNGYGFDYLNPETLGNIDYFFSKFFTKEISDLGYKMEDHELFLVDLIKLINSKISASTEHLDNNIKDIKTFIAKLFKDKDFRDQVNSIANDNFKTSYYPNELLKNSKYRDLRDMIISNVKELIQSGTDARLGLSYDYDPHFKSTVRLSVSDFPGKKIYVIGKSAPITNDNDLNTYRNSFKGALKIYHRRNDKRVYLVPISQMKKGLKDSEGFLLYSGYLDDNRNVHPNIFVADADGYKLNSRFAFSEDGFHIRENSYWSGKYFKFEIDNSDSEGIIIYTSNFYAAFNVISGDTVISGLQDIIINLEHIDSIPHVLPEIQISKKFSGRNPRIISKSHVSIELNKKINSLISVIEQLTNAKSWKGIATNIKIDDAFLNFFPKKGVTYSVENFKLILKALDLKDANFAKLTRGIIQIDGTFKKNDITPQQFYQEWFNKIQIDLNLQTPLVFGEHKSLKSVSFTGSSGQIAMIDAALQDVFGYPAFICLLGGIMIFSEDSSQNLGYRIDFIKHTQEDQAILLRNFLGRVLHDSNPKSIADQYLSGQLRRFPVRTFYWAEAFLFGFRRGNTIINPSSNYFTDNYYSTFEPELISDFSFAT